MKQTIEIEVPDGKKAVWKNGKVVFEDIEPQLPKTWWEFCKQNKMKNNECYIDNTSYIRETYIGERRKNEDRNILPSKQAAEQHLALMQLHQLRDCYRQGWKPNYTDDSQKWYILKNHDKLSVDWNISYSVFLNFQTRELAEQFLKNFKDLIEQAGDLI